VPLPKTSTIEYDDIILLVGKDRRTFIRRVVPGQRFECHLGFILFDDLVGRPYGSQFATNIGHKLFALAPNTDDIIRHLHREGQIIYPKDLGYIALKLGIRPGVSVLEAGSGSGALTLTLALLVGDEGHVFSYERRSDMQARAIANIKRLQLEHRVTFNQRDIERGFDETGLHALFLDVREPWLYLDQARAALRGGGFFGALVPTMNQVIELSDRLYDGAWYLLEIEELLLRTYKTIPARIRPDDQMVGHTGYLVFARAVDRVQDAELEAIEGPRDDEEPDDSGEDGDTQEVPTVSESDDTAGDTAIDGDEPVAV